MKFTCDQCGQQFTEKRSLIRHIHSTHEDITYTCSVCGKSFTRKHNRDIHEDSCQLYPCDECSEELKTRRELEFHKKMKHQRKRASRDSPHARPVKRARTKSPQPSTSSERPQTGASPQPGPSSVRCHECGWRFDNRVDLKAHQTSTHYQEGRGLNHQPFDDTQAPWVQQDGQIDTALRDCYRLNRPLILERDTEGPVQSMFNVPIQPNMGFDDIQNALENIFDRQRTAFKVNLAFGFIMRNIQSLRYRYFIAHDNVNVLEAPVLISNRRDIDRLMLKLRSLDIVERTRRQRPDTKWKLEILTNIRIKVYHTAYTLGSPVELPPHIKHNKALVSLDTNPVTKKHYRDELCMFRCLSMHLHGSVDETRVDALYTTWNQFSNSTISKKAFKGLDFVDIPNFEECFGVNVQVYELEEDGVTYPVFKSTLRYGSTLYCNHYQQHLSYIRNFEMYAKKYRCQLCDRLFDHHGHFTRHEKVCDHKTKFRYPGGFHQQPRSIYEELELIGIHVELQDRTYPWFAVFDFESILEEVQNEGTDNLTWTRRHVPISVSVCSNVPGYTEPQCFVEPDLDKLLTDMMGHLQQIRKSAKSLEKDKWSSYLDDLTELLDEAEMEDYDGPSAPQQLKNIYGKIKGYIKCLPVLGFNSAHYDLNLVKRKLAKHLCMDDEDHQFTVKKGNNYACIATESFKFLDISHFLAPGCSYASFLKAFQVEEMKGFFPYAHLNHVSKLDVPELPPIEAFSNALKGTTLTEEEYAVCERAWQEHNMSTFKDFLVWYNNLDVVPFVTAVQKFQKFYFNKGIDVFKTAISVPGIARKLLFNAAREEGAELSLIDRANQDLYHTIKQNIVGGPSIIFTRHHKSGKTRIRGGKLCKTCIGYDCNALYLYSLDQEMPEGMFVRRRSTNGFRPEFRDKYMKAFNWLNYLNQHEGKHILHLRNNGSEVRKGKYPVDGFDPEEQRVYEFQGCYQHGHQCRLTANIKDEKWLKGREDRLKKTHAKLAYLRSNGYDVVELWECQYSEFCKRHPQIYAIIKACRPTFSQKHPGTVSESQILNGVRSGQLFGMLEVDISIPERWDSDFQKALPPSEYFSEMCPIFCNTDVPFEDIGPHMQAHIREVGLSDKPRRLLVGGLKARQILLASPLVEWYLNHGLRVTKIYQVIEYRKLRCFKTFVREVSDARRAGDVAPEKAIIADTMKLIGNSGYGSLIMDKTKHRQIKYVKGENKARFEVNIPQFRDMTCLDTEDQLYEIEKAKAKISLDLPIQLAFFVLQHAKLRMVQFYYNCLDEYVPRHRFEFLEMDTDSAYMALSASSLKEVVRPEKRAEYERGITGLCDDSYNSVEGRWFPRECCDRHAKYDKRAPGLFKTEYQGDEMIGLCSKTYVISQTVTSKTVATRVTAHRLLRKAKGLKKKCMPSKPQSKIECKFSSKGITKRFIKDPLLIFRKVLTTQRPKSGVNKGFRLRNNEIFSYEQQRCGFSYFYCKRRVLDDGIHTVPLDITLCPVVEAQLDSSDLELVDILVDLFEDQ